MLTQKPTKVDILVRSFGELLCEDQLPYREDYLYIGLGTVPLTEEEYDSKSKNSRWGPTKDKPQPLNMLFLFDNGTYMEDTLIVPFSVRINSFCICNEEKPVNNNEIYYWSCIDLNKQKISVLV